MRRLLLGGIFPSFRLTKVKWELTDTKLEVDMNHVFVALAEQRKRNQKLEEELAELKRVLKNTEAKFHSEQMICMFCSNKNSVNSTSKQFKFQIGRAI